MFKRTLQVKMVKTPKCADDAPDQTDTTLEGKTAIAGYAVERIVEKVASAIVTYIVMDTIRQVIVARANRQ